MSLLVITELSSLPQFNSFMENPAKWDNSTTCFQNNAPANKQGISGNQQRAFLAGWSVFSYIERPFLLWLHPDTDAQVVSHSAHEPSQCMLFGHLQARKIKTGQVMNHSSTSNSTSGLNYLESSTIMWPFGVSEPLLVLWSFSVSDISCAAAIVSFTIQ